MNIVQNQTTASRDNDDDDSNSESMDVELLGGSAIGPPMLVAESGLIPTFPTVSDATSELARLAQST